MAQLLELIPCCDSKFILHRVRVTHGNLQLLSSGTAGRLELEIRLQPERRLCLMQNHTALHLLTASLAEFLAPVSFVQRSSAIFPDRLQLSVSCPVPFDEYLLECVEQKCRSLIDANHMVDRYIEQFQTVDRAVVRTLPDVDYPSEVDCG